MCASPFFNFKLARLALYSLFGVRIALTTANAVTPAGAWDAPGQANPFLPGYYADASVVQADGHIFIYATLDPWGGKTLGCWESTDFKNWEYRTLNWPTKEACTSPTSGGAMVWAPSVVHARNGQYYMYVSVGSEVWVGTAERPFGPWKNALGDKPLINKDAKPGFHMIDAECFIDSDGQAYLYWGSGWNWTNGHCFAVKLKPDMATFDGETYDVTPPNGHYFEGPFMVKQGSRYFLMYSDGKTVSDTYCVHYSVGETPFGPFKEAANSPILASDHAANILSPGHHAVMRYQDKTYIVYHRHSIPFVENEAYRQLCIDEMKFGADGKTIEKVVATHHGPSFVQRNAAEGNLASSASGAKITASSTESEFYRPERVLDDNYATRWKAKPDTKGAWLEIDLGSVRHVARSELRLEYAWKNYAIALEKSVDGKTWTTVADYREKGIEGSPTKFACEGDYRYLRVIFSEAMKGSDISVWEWAVYGTK